VLRRALNELRGTHFNRAKRAVAPKVDAEAE
jgi:hypothetical protein